jgi:hypothetical protein
MFRILLFYVGWVRMYQELFHEIFIRGFSRTKESTPFIHKSSGGMGVRHHQAASHRTGIRKQGGTF